MAYLIVRALTFRAVHGVKKMGEIQNENQDLILDLNLEQKLNNQLKKLLREQPRGSNKTFELKGHSSILFANLAAITLASCGTSSGSTDYSSGAPTPTANAAPNAGVDFTFDFTEDIPASFGIGAPTDADGDVLTITVDSIPTTGVLTTSDGDVITQGMTLVAGQLEGLTFTPNANLNDDNTTPGTLTLTASDGSLSDSATFTFIIYAVNDLPTSIDLTSTSMAENVAGIAVGTVSSDDGDLDNTFTISGTDADKFELSNGTLKLKDTVTADYETQTSYSIVITATDSDDFPQELVKFAEHLASNDKTVFDVFSEMDLNNDKILDAVELREGLSAMEIADLAPWDVDALLIDVDLSGDV